MRRFLFLTKEVVTLNQMNIEKRLDAMILSLKDSRLRWLIGKGKSLIDQGKISIEEYETVIKDIFQTEMQRKMIINELVSGPLTVSEISTRIGLPLNIALKHLIAMRRNNAVAIIGERDDELEFQLL